MGHAPPDTPITANVYARMSLNFFKESSDEQCAVNDVSGGYNNLVGAA